MLFQRKSDGKLMFLELLLENYCNFFFFVLCAISITRGPGQEIRNSTVSHVASLRSASLFTISAFICPEKNFFFK